MKSKDEYIQIIDEMLGLLSEGYSDAKLSQIHFRLKTIVENLYGANNSRSKHIDAFKEKYPTYSDDFSALLVGALTAIKKDLEHELIFNVEKQITGAVVADFIALAKDAIEKDSKDVAAVLASAAIEDALKRFAVLNGLSVHDGDMTTVVNALKGKELIKGPQASVVSSYVKLRNKAFHAKWGEIEKPEVSSLISFTESFIL